MKKILALVAVIALVAFAAPAFAAANPFMDVPMNHWAYDAIGQLAARGVLSGYPDGTYKGNQPMTRYEVASAVARALAVVDMTKASKQDVEMLKKLVVEFKDELDALGVKVDKLDSRVAVLEEGVGGWKLTGEFRFDSRTTDNDNSTLYGVNNKWDQNTTRVRLHFYKQISDGVSFYGRFHGAGGDSPKWTRAYVDVDLPWEMHLRAGRQSIDWEDALYWVPFGTWQTDGLLTDRDGLEAFYLTKNFSMGQFGLYASRKDSAEEVTNPADKDYTGIKEHWEYAARFVFNFNEQFSLMAGYQMIDFENEEPGNTKDNDFATWYVEPQVKFSENFILKGAYYSQDTEHFGDKVVGASDDPSAWRAIFEVKQEALKFTSLWLEYNQVDAGFVTPNKETYKFIANVYDYAPLYRNYGYGDFMQIQNDADIWRIGAFQKWSDKWDTFLHYAKFDIDGMSPRTNGGSLVDNDADNYSIGFNYHYTPAVTFSLAYDKFDSDIEKYDDDMIHFRTRVVF
ncbi:porin [Aminivibrio sp.]|uniref:porin n=1 Tax=Aminivibrio sp. TaxID=1872489 RepID=UPI001A49CF6B|nr:porin [Aminivibrio sp.]MBL3540425.1 S-layer homology domain-containing protein [Aminivibrio sp.]